MRVTKQLVAKVYNGDPISDDELKALSLWIDDLVDKLELLSPRYDLALNDARQMQTQFDNFKWNRTNRP